MTSKFLAGVLVAVPTIVTFLALRFLFRQVDGIFSPWVTNLVGRHVPGLGIVATILIVFIVGYTATNFMGRRFVKLSERLLAQLPLVRTIYKSSKEIVHAATMSRRQVFRDLVMIEYPRKGAYSYGFVTSYTTRHNAEGSKRLANVFIPGPPVPTTGVLIAIPIDDLFCLDVSTEDALKLILSGGVASPADLREREPQREDERYET
jgi:uncharacterized membrane protein